MTFSNSLIKSVAIPTLLLIFLPIFCGAQTVDKSDVITKIDFSGKSFDAVLMGCTSITNNDYVIVLARKDDEQLVSEITGQLKALFHANYTRIGLALRDEYQNEKNLVVSIFVNGTLYAVIEDAKPDTKTSWEVYNLVKDAYQENIWPKLRNSAKSDGH